MDSGEQQATYDGQRVEAIQRFGLLGSHTEPALDRLTRLATLLVRAPLSFVTIANADQLLIKSSYGVSGEFQAPSTLRLNESFCTFVIQDQRSLSIPDTLSSSFCESPLATREGLRSYLGMPLTLSDGTTIGAFSVGDIHPRHWSEDEISALEDLTALLVSEIELRQMPNDPHYQFEAEHRHQQEQLRESELRKAAVLEAALDCIITIDHEGRVVEFNAAAERTFGYSRDYATGRLVADLIMPEEHRQPCLDAFTRHLQTGESSLLGHRIERPAMRADGTIIQTEMAITRIDLPGNAHPLFTAYLRDITERKRAEEEIRIHKHMVDAVGQAIIAIDNSPERRITYWNRAAEQILGWTAEEAIGRGFFETVPAPEFHGEVSRIGQHVRQGNNWQGEFQLQHQDGTIIPALATVDPILNDDGELLGVISVYTDLTEINQTEREVRLYKHIVDGVGESVVASDMDRRIIYANHAAERALGWSIDDVKGLDIRDVVPAEDNREKSTWIGSEVREKGERVTEEFMLRRTNGETFPALVSLAPIFGDGDELIGTIGIYTDISELKQTEQDIRFFKHIVDAIGEAVVATSLSGDITYVNSAAERMLGWPANELIGKPLLSTIPNQARIADAQEIARNVRTGKPWFGEFSLQRKDGSTFPALISLAPMTDETGETTGIISVYSEISDLKSAEEENRFFKYVVDAVGQVVIANDLDRKITYWNQAAEDILGWKAEEVVGVDAATIAPAPDFLPTIPEITAVVRSGDTWVGEFPLQHRDGSVIPALTTLNPIFNETGDIIGVLGAHTDIRVLKQTEQDLRFHKHIVDAVGQAVIATDLQGRIQYWNNAAQQIYGWSTEEVIGQPIADVTSANASRQLASEIVSLLAAGEPWSGEFLALRRDGSEFVAYITISPIHDDLGELVGAIGISHDISDQKEYERQIEFHKIMLDAVGQTIVTTDMNRVITYWSRGAEHALGWTAEEVIGRHIGDIAPAAHLNEEAGKLHKAVREGSSWTGEFPIRRKDGSTFPAVVNLAPVTLADQGTVGVIGVYTDISELKTTEHELRLHKHMLDAVGQAVFAADEQLRISYMNRATELLYGYSPADALGKKLLDFLPTGSDSQHEAAHALEIVATEGGWSGELLTYDKDGIEIPALVSASPILSEDGNHVGLIVAMADITERRRVEEALKHSNEQITEILETMGEGFVTLNRDWSIQYVNHMAEQILKRDRGDLLGRNLWTEFPEPDDEPFYRAFAKALESGQSVEVTGYDPYLDMWLEVHASPSREQLSIFFRDVTKRHEHEVALREAEERYRTLIEQIPAMTYIATPDDVSKLIYISPQVEQMLGYSVEQWLAEPTFWMELLHPADKAYVKASDEKTVSEGHEHFTLEYRLRARDGSYRWIRDTATLIRDIEGNPQYWQGLSHNITEEKRAERTILESEQRFRSLFDNHPEAVFSIDHTARVLSANLAFEAMTGYSTLQAGVLHFVDLVVPEDQERVRERFEETHQGHPQDFRAGITDPEGKRIELSLTTIPIIVDSDIVGVHVVAQDVTIHQELENQLAHQAYHDSLTGLPNRNLFQNQLDERLDSARQHGDMFAVLFFDLDDFKVINDSLGHSAGDQLLVQVAERVQTCIRNGDLLARLGGDEFTLLLGRVANNQDAIVIAERIADVLDEPFTVDDHEVFASTSVGIAIGNSSSPSSDDILRNADLAMYEAKNSGKDRYALFEPSMNSRAWLRLTLESEIRRGIPQEEFAVYYQPIVDLQSGELHGVEALVRWKHPTRGFLTPYEFISVAEQSGLILPLGRWIIREACTQLRGWQDMMPEGKTLQLSLNLSSKQYQHPRLIEELTRTLKAVDLDPRLITLEITESIAMGDSPDMVQTLEQLKEVGVQLALDDFGTGFSALSYLRRFPIDIIKIDQSFVDGLGTDPEDTNIVQAVMATSLAMKLQVTAEGIETIEQLNTLRKLGCQYGQGYLFARALAPEEMQQIITSSDSPWRTLIDSAPSPSSSAG